jgi:hypothetical protein
MRAPAACGIGARGAVVKLLAIALQSAHGRRRSVGRSPSCERQACMTIRSRRESVTFKHPLRIRGIERLLPAGAYEIVTYISPRNKSRGARQRRASRRMGHKEITHQDLFQVRWPCEAGVKEQSRKGAIA